MPGVTSSPVKFDLCWRSQLTDYVTAMDWSPGGQFLAASSAGGDVTVWAFPSREPLFRFQDAKPISCLQVSLDGSVLAASGQRGQVMLWDLVASSSQTPVCLDPVDAWVDRLVWQPGTRNLAFNVNRQVYVVDTAAQQVITRLDFPHSSVLGLAWSPSGTHLAVCGHHGTRVWDASNWGADPYFLQVPGASLTAAWSKDGRYLATGNYDRTLSVLEWGHPPPWLMQGFPGKIRQLNWSDCGPGRNSDSPLLAAACVEGITVWERKGRGLDAWSYRVLQLHKDFVQAIAFQPGQRLLVSADHSGVLGLWQGADRLLQTITGVTQGFTQLCWHPQGTHLVAGGQAGEIMMWKQSRVNSKKGFG